MIVGLAAALVYAAMFALVFFVKPTPADLTVPVPIDKLLDEARP